MTSSTSFRSWNVSVFFSPSASDDTMTSYGSPTMGPLSMVTMMSWIPKSAEISSSEKSSFSAIACATLDAFSKVTSTIRLPSKVRYCFASAMEMCVASFRKSSFVRSNSISACS